MINARRRHTLSNFMGQALQKKTGSYKASNEALTKIATETKNLTGHQALAMVLKVACADKKTKQFSLADKIKQ